MSTENDPYFVSRRVFDEALSVNRREGGRCARSPSVDGVRQSVTQQQREQVITTTPMYSDRRQGNLQIAW